MIMQSGGGDEFLHETAESLHHHFDIHHTTIQIERSDINGICRGGNTNELGRCWPGRSDFSEAMTAEGIR